MSQQYWLAIAWLIIQAIFGNYYVPGLDLNRDGAVNALDLQIAVNNKLLVPMEPLAMHGVAVIVTHERRIWALAGNMCFARSGFELTVYNWPAGLHVSQGDQLVDVAYSPAPLFSVLFRSDGIVIGIVPSDECWRQACRDVNMVRTETRRIEVSERNGATVIYLEYVR